MANAINHFNSKGNKRELLITFYQHQKGNKALPSTLFVEKKRPNQGRTQGGGWD